jgi:hypothetical protein
MGTPKEDALELAVKALANLCAPDGVEVAGVKFQIHFNDQNHLVVTSQWGVFPKVSFKDFWEGFITSLSTYLTSADKADKAEEVMDLVARLVATLGELEGRLAE